MDYQTEETSSLSIASYRPPHRSRTPWHSGLPCHRHTYFPPSHPAHKTQGVGCLSGYQTLRLRKGPQSFVTVAGVLRGQARLKLSLDISVVGSYGTCWRRLLASWVPCWSRHWGQSQTYLGSALSPTWASGYLHLLRSKLAAEGNKKYIKHCLKYNNGHIPSWTKYSDVDVHKRYEREEAIRSRWIGRRRFTTPMCHSLRSKLLNCFSSISCKNNGSED
jgi:hypothetical protein